ncbi:MAG: response regulator [Pseudosphingobacterium sp.]|nr:response regulator [Pseudosphingobacterium sp.]
MFKKVLIVEDHEVTNISVRKTVEELGIPITKYVYYCDDAFTWMQNALKSGEPYDLLISDLFFEEDEIKQKLAGGIELIKATRQLQPNLKVLVFSAESRPATIDAIFKELAIDGYVRKARRDAQALKQAISTIYKGGKYIPTDLKQSIKKKNSHEFTAFDITIIKLLSQGVLQKDIPFYLQQHNIKPSGLSSVEKRLGQIKEVLEFSKNEQLVIYCKEMGLI